MNSDLEKKCCFIVFRVEELILKDKFIINRIREGGVC